MEAGDNIAESEIPVPEAGEEPPTKKSKIAEEALKKIAEEKEKREKEKLEAEERAKNAKKAELEKFWKVVKDDPSDFTGWTHLLQYVDNRNELEVGREVFNSFLRRYPYCYGYWKKFADFEKRNGTSERVFEVFEEGVKAIPLSVDLWIHYLNHVKTVCKEEPDKIRTLYERSVSDCGREWKSDKLWDSYVKWETTVRMSFTVHCIASCLKYFKEMANTTGVYQLYHRILTTPTHGINKNLDNFQSWLNTINPKDLLETTEFLAMRKEALGKMNEEEAMDDDSAAAPGENAEGDLMSAEETKKIREMIVAKMKAMMGPAEERISLRSKYEEAIKRPYFHVKPLERGQLKNWNDYLEFMTKEMSKEGGDMSEVEIIFERALIACALYEEFWMNYVKWWTERDGDNTDKVRNIYKRACFYHLQEKVDIHIQWASFEEKLGRYDEAAFVLENIEKAHPQLISLVVARINLERRRGNHQDVGEIYQNIIKTANNKATASELSIKYARYLRLHVGDISKAGQVIASALETDPTNPKLYLQHLDLLLNTSPLNIEAVTTVFDKALEQEFPDKHKLLFSQRKVEFLGDFGSDISVIETAKQEHTKLEADVKEREEAAAAAKAKEADKDKKVDSNGTTATYAPVNSNSSAYNAQQAQAYNNYGARYNNYQGGAGGPGYGQWQGQGQGY